VALLSANGRIEGEREVSSGAVYLRYPVASDYGAWSRLREESRGFLVPWEPVWPVDDLTRAAFRRRLRRYAKEIRDEIAHPFFVFRASDTAFLGSCILSNIRRGVAQAATLGYWVGQRHARKGYMTEAVRGAINFAFDELGLHRLEAACLPANEPSRKLLARVGFSEEGQARAYLKINGRWEDHMLFGMVATDPRV
jgi:[ribosomal protein S5]-alanine N-acetyltransferase